ncbi:MAG: acetyl-CoA carboxylase carboxyltransferase subunit alpha [Armatimonadetes bacterium]|nr:acetyl-CoA carboxylase carboxyltransferase subunit alpha [Armatimonadota bacterium]
MSYPADHLEQVWQHVALSRHEQRPYTLDYVQAIFEHFVELHGDRRYGDDGAMVAGLGFLEGQPVAIVGHQKGRSLAERQRRNFGMARPEGYRKALRVMRLAANLGRPIISFIDTPGADCVADAESRGISEAIAVNQQEMFGLPVPIVVVVIGEGGSGGAIGIGVGDRVFMMENSYYSVIAPESCAAILWRDPNLKKEAAVALKLSPEDALALGVIDGIIPEPPGGAHTAPAEAARHVKQTLLTALAELSAVPPDVLVQARYEKFRWMSSPAGMREEWAAVLDNLAKRR